MKTNIIKLEYIKTTTSNTYGGTKTEVEYILKTECGGMINRYEITAEVKGFGTADLYLIMVECKPLDNNENTLVTEAIEYLLNW